MLILQLFIFALFFLGFGIFSILKKKIFIGFTFALLGTLLIVIGLVAVYLYPNILP